MLWGRTSSYFILLLYNSPSQIETLRRVLQIAALCANPLSFCGVGIAPTACRVQHIFEVNEQVAQIIHFS